MAPISHTHTHTHTHTHKLLGYRYILAHSVPHSCSLPCLSLFVMPECYRDGIMYYENFWGKLFSQDIRFLRHMILHVSIVNFFCSEMPLHQCTIDRYLDCFRYLGYCECYNWTWECTCHLEILISLYLDIHAEIRLLDHSNSILNSLRSILIAFSKSCINLHFLQQCTRVPFIYILANIYHFFNIFSNSHKVISHYDFDVHFLND